MTDKEIDYYIHRTTDRIKELKEYYCGLEGRTKQYAERMIKDNENILKLLLSLETGSGNFKQPLH